MKVEDKDEAYLLFSHKEALGRQTVDPNLEFGRSSNSPRQSSGDEVFTIYRVRTKPAAG